ncbi:MAG: DNA translocase FtsK 4TM domain-containing protein, partial [Smithella sp.]
MAEKQTDNKRPREIKGVVCLSLAFFLLLCLASYHPQDPSFTHFVASGQATHNFTGKAGSYAADSFIRLFGIASFLLPLMLLVCSFKYFLRPEFTMNAHRSLGFLFFVLSFAGIISILIGGSARIYGESLNYGVGGFIGVNIVDLLRIYFNIAGTYIILFLIFIVSLTFMIEFSIVSVTERISQFTLALITPPKNRLSSFVNFVFNTMKTEKKPQPVIIEDTTPIVKKAPPKKIEQTRFDFT